LVAGATVVVAVLRKSLLPSQFVVLCGVAYVWQVLFASYATRYVYFPGFLLIALGIAFAMAERGGDTRAAVRT